MSNELLEQVDIWGVEKYGVQLHINQMGLFNSITPIIIDIETDEFDNFVGIGMTQDGRNIYYYTELKDINEYIFTNQYFVGHNLKGDLKWLKQWGIDINSSQIYFDTMLASYVQNTTKESHSLKDLAKEYLNIEYPTYKEIVGKRNKVTLDQQPIELTANYCAMDVYSTYCLYEYFLRNLSESQKQYLNEIEIPTNRVLMDMELRGMRMDVPYLEQLDKEFKSKLDDINKKILKFAEEKGILVKRFIKNQGIRNDIIIVDGKQNGKTKQKEQIFNIDSSKHLTQLIESYGVSLPLTNKGNKKTDKATFEHFNHLPPVELLLNYSKFKKLHSTYIKGLLNKQKNGIVSGNFNQLSRNEKEESVGIGTGRLSSSNPNLQNIPTRTEEGKMIRKAFVCNKGNVLLDADFSQIEPRLVAHITKDKTFVDAFLTGRDIYSELVEGTGRDRNDGKTFMLALLYGAQAKKLSKVFKCSEEESEDIINRIMSKLPAVESWIEKTKYSAKRNGGVSTIFGRWIPLPGIKSENKWERMHWERVAVNSIIQGSAAEIMKKSLIKLDEEGYKPILTVHDSFMMEIKDDEQIKSNSFIDIKHILENEVIELNVPLSVSVGFGYNWKQCKENEIK